MGLSSFPSAAEGLLPVLVMNTVMSVAILKNLVKSVLQLVGAVGNWISSNLEENPSSQSSIQVCPESNSGRSMKKGISITQFKYLLCDRELREINNNNNNNNNNNDSSSTSTTMECCVCLCKFGEEEEVSELSCKHFFHTNCLDKWFHNHHTTCPLCRSFH